VPSFQAIRSGCRSHSRHPPCPLPVGDTGTVRSRGNRRAHPEGLARAGEGGGQGAKVRTRDECSVGGCTWCADADQKRTLDAMRRCAGRTRGPGVRGGCAASSPGTSVAGNVHSIGCATGRAFIQCDGHAKQCQCAPERSTVRPVPGVLHGQAGECGGIARRSRALIPSVVGLDAPFHLASSARRRSGRQPKRAPHSPQSRITFPLDRTLGPGGTPPPVLWSRGTDRHWSRGACLAGRPRIRRARGGASSCLPQEVCLLLIKVKSVVDLPGFGHRWPRSTGRGMQCIVPIAHPHEDVRCSAPWVR